MSTTTTVQAAQLMYSNVEAEHSSSGRRGFQVWLASPRLKDQQRDIARRLEDFEWPAKEATANKPTQRLAFFKTPVGDYVVAHTVPLTERDVLKRAGRFHTHALIFTPSELAKIGFDPFRVIDHFPFLGSPTSLIESGEWRKGLPDVTEITVGPAKLADPALNGILLKMLPTIVRWLDGPDDPRPIAIPVNPERLSALMRVIFHAIPPTMREKASFDTLSSGQTLTALPIRFAGAYDAQSLKDWPYRRAYRLDADTGDFSTPPEVAKNPGLDYLATEWAKTPDLPDSDREGTYRLLKCLYEPTAKLPEGYSERSMEIVRAAPGGETALASRTQAWLTKSLPAASLRPMVLPQAQAWIGAFSPESLVKLSTPAPVDELAAWLFQICEAASSLTLQQATELEQWSHDQIAAGKGEGRVLLAKLYLIALRWQPSSAKRLEERRKDESWASLLNEWFTPWFLKNTPILGYLQTDADAASFAEGIFQTSPRLPDDMLIELERFLAVTDSTTVYAPSYKRLSFAVAFRRKDAGKMSWLLTEQDDDFVRWVVVQAQKQGISVRLGIGGLEVLPGIIVGAGLHPAPDGCEALLEALAEHHHTRALLYDIGVRTAEQIAPAPTVYPTAVATALAAIQRKGNLEAELCKLGSTAFRVFLAENFLDKARVTRLIHNLGDGSELWIGPSVESIGVYPEQFQGLYRAIIAVMRKEPARLEERVAALLAAIQGRSS